MQSFVRSSRGLALVVGTLLALGTHSAFAAPAKNEKKRRAPVENTQSYEGEDKSAGESYESYSSGRASRGQVGLELLGAGLLYSLQGSYLVADKVALNGGLSYYSISGTATSGGTTSSASVGVFMLPLSASYLMGGPDHHFEVLGGGSLLFASAEVSGGGITDKASGSSFLGQIGAGYRYWPAEGGFHFRATLYGMFIPSNFAIWPGFSFGYAF